MKTALQMAVTILYLVYSDSQGSAKLPFFYCPGWDIPYQVRASCPFYFQIKKGTEYAEKL